MRVSSKTATVLLRMSRIEWPDPDSTGSTDPVLHQWQAVAHGIHATEPRTGAMHESPRTIHPILTRHDKPWSKSACGDPGRAVIGRHVQAEPSFHSTTLDFSPWAASNTPGEWESRDALSRSGSGVSLTSCISFVLVLHNMVGLIQGPATAENRPMSVCTRLMVQTRLG